MFASTTEDVIRADPVRYAWNKAVVYLTVKKEARAYSQQQAMSGEEGGTNATGGVRGNSLLLSKESDDQPMIMLSSPNM